MQLSGSGSLKWIRLFGGTCFRSVRQKAVYLLLSVCDECSISTLVWHTLLAMRGGTGGLAMRGGTGDLAMRGGTGAFAMRSGTGGRS